MATILIVDDHPTNREYLVTLLGSGTHRVLETADGAEALAIARAEHLDLVIADILMPTMGGDELVRQLRKEPASAAVPVIFYTAPYHEREARALADACGVFHVLSKPAEPEVLLRTVDAALGGSPPPAAPISTGEFDAEHLRLLTDKLSENAGNLKRANERLTALIDLGVELGSERDPRRVLQRFCHVARKIIGTRYAIAGIVDGDGQQLRYFFTSGMDKETATRLGAPDPERGGPATVLRESRCLCLHNPGGNPATIDFPSTYPPLHAWLGAPIVSPGRVHGWLGLLNKVGAEGFGAEDERLAGILAAQVGRIYENSSLYAELVRHSAELKLEIGERKRAEQNLAERARLASLVGDVGVALTQGNSLKDTLDSCALALVRNLDAAFARIWTVNEAQDVLELQASAGLYTHTDGPHGRVPIGQFKIGLIARERKPHLTNDVRNDPLVSDREWAAREGMVAFAGYPLLVGDRLVGVMALFARQPLGSATLQAMTAVVDQIGLSIEHQRAEAAVRHSEARKAAILHASLDAIITMDHEGKIRGWNPAAERIFGYSVSAALGRPLAELIIPPSQRQRHVRGLVNYLATGHGPILENRLELSALRADGSEFPVELTVTRIPVEGPAMFTAYLRDITHRKRTEQRLTTQHAVVSILAQAVDLREAAPRVLRAACKSTGWDLGDLWVVDKQTNLLSYIDLWNVEGLDAAEFLDLSRRSKFAPGDCLPGRVWATRQPVWIVDISRDPDMRRADAAAKAGLRGGFGFPIQFGDEVLGVAEFFSRESRQPDAELLRMFESLGSQIGQFVERKRVERGLRLFRALIDQTKVGIEVIEPETGRFLDVNEQACVAHGYTREEYLSLSVPDIDPLVATKSWAEVMEEYRLVGFRTIESLHRRKDGSTFPVEINFNPIHLDRDFMVAVVRDITERKQLEDQYRQAQKMEAVGQLAGGVAHDFNNLLTIINGYGELVMGAIPVGDPTRKLIQEIVSAGDRAAALTRQLLAFSRKAILEPRLLDLKAVVADMGMMLRRLIGEDLQLAVVIDPEVGAVKADPGQIDQVILNLVVNARDAMPRGGKLTVELRNAELDEAYALGHPEARPGPYVLLAVTDTGCGMDRATMSRIFEPFFSTKGENGTGLGLATVHGIVKQSGGHLAVYSEVGIGTTFKVYLPRLEQRPGLGKASPGQAEMLRGSETVLLVEDEDGVRALGRHILQGSGYTVLEARDGSEAVRVAEHHRGRIDLLVTDVVMPRMGGREVAERLVGLHPGVKVLFLSGYTDDAVVRHGILEAAVSFLQKPFSPASLSAKVREVLDGV